MSDNGENPAKKVTQAATENVQRGVQAMQDAGKVARDAGRQTAESFGRAAQDMGRKATESGFAGMAEFSKMFSDMKFPGMPDMDAFLSAHRRNMETLSAANRVALEGAQTVAKRHMEIVQQTMAEMTDTIRELTSTDTPQQRAARQAELIKQTYERAVSHIKELADLIQRSNGEALSMLHQRFTEAMDEVKVLDQKSGQK